MALGAFGIGVILLPLGSTVRHTSQFSKMQRLDIGGAVILTSSLCLFILGLTSKLLVIATDHCCDQLSFHPRDLGGTTDGWTSAKFLAPFLIAVFLFAGFWVWESFQHDDRALLPIALMRSPNLILLCFTA